MEDLQKDSEAKVIRFTCGAIFGFLSSAVACYLFLAVRSDSPIIAWFLIALGTYVSGYLAMKYGDYFWKNIVNRWWFW